MFSPNNKARLRKGMWVVFDDQVGILTAFRGDAVEVRTVDEAGEDKLLVLVPEKAVNQAKYENFPEARRPTPEVAAAFGYL